MCVKTDGTGDVKDSLQEVLGRGYRQTDRWTSQHKQTYSTHAYRKVKEGLEYRRKKRVLEKINLIIMILVVRCRPLIWQAIMGVRVCDERTEFGCHIFPDEFGPVSLC